MPFSLFQLLISMGFFFAVDIFHFLIEVCLTREMLNIAGVCKQNVSHSNIVCVCACMRARVEVCVCAVVIKHGCLSLLM